MAAAQADEADLDDEASFQMYHDDPIEIMVDGVVDQSEMDSSGEARIVLDGYRYVRIDCLSEM